jgi:hypothetical protein
LEFPVCSSCFSEEIDVFLFIRFVAVEKIKENLLENNKKTYWVPDYVKVATHHLIS